MTGSARDVMAEGIGLIAVLDMGKTNVKLSAVTGKGEVLETLSTPNTVRDGPPWRHNDLAGLGDWALAELAALCRRHKVAHVVAAGYGSGGVLVGADPDAPGGGAVLPMIDYEQPLPAAVAADYVPMAGSFLDRGSGIMQASTHQARQLFWMERERPHDVAAARWYLGLPQYWAWRFSGIAASEHSILGAQSHLWNVAEQRFSPIVRQRNWRRLMPSLVPAWRTLGPLRPSLARRFGLPEGICVHVGAHDSSLNFYRYQAACLDDVTVISTGTWIVALAGRVPLASLDEVRNMTCNSDIFGRPVGGALTMGGREFGHVAGRQEPGAFADPRMVARLVGRGTMALPAFGADSGQFPGCAGRGMIAGTPPETPAERLALAVLYMAQLTAACAGTLGGSRRVILDGSYLQDPLYAGLVAALWPDAAVFHCPEPYGVAAGAALLCRQETRRGPAEVTLLPVARPPDLPPISAYHAQWYAVSTRSH